MDREEIRTEIVASIRDILGDDSLEVQETDSLVDDLEISSLEGFELMFSLEEKFDCTIEEKKVREFVTVGDIVDYMFCSKNNGLV